ncbi:hypothetical protein [Rhizobium sp. CF142]|uniref:hypothetical protein n=1 Tax=Rhizobium sp. CF142 TaxID=1144314 RepID=UPI00026EFEEB|nr:hypothetical protein [Rhizobium sp. CF142]EJJ28663.1 hypothetical protein PMI11_03044 [Rhizobium sp. CF142]
MIDLSLPWAIGPVPLGLTMAAAYGVFFSFVTRKGFSFNLFASAVGLVSGVAAFAVHLWRPSVDHMTILLTAQVVCTGVVFLLCWLSWVARKPEGKPQKLVSNMAPIKGLLASLAFPLVIDVLFYLFPITSGYCGRLTSDYSGGKCRAQENFWGLHDLPLEIYFGVLLGVFGLGAFIVVVFRLCLGVFRPKRGEAAPVIEDWVNR